MRVLFMGTGEIAIPSLEYLIKSVHRVVGVVTQPDKPVGRGQVLTSPEIKLIAESKDIPVFQPTRIKRLSVLKELEALKAEIIVVMAYGQILPKKLLEMPSLACLNLHASLLPKHRGASPIQASILQGDSETGITVMHIAEALDSGDMILKKVIPLTGEETGSSLHDQLAVLAPEALDEALTLLQSSKATREAQDDEEATYCGKMSRDLAEIDWSKPAEELEREIRAYHSWPGSFTCLKMPNGRQKKLKIFPPTTVNVTVSGTPGEVVVEDGQVWVNTGKGRLRLAEVQLEGKKRLGITEFTVGTDLRGRVLGEK